MRLSLAATCLRANCDGAGRRQERHVAEAAAPAQNLGVFCTLPASLLQFRLADHLSLLRNRHAAVLQPPGPFTRCGPSRASKPQQHTVTGLRGRWPLQVLRLSDCRVLSLCVPSSARHVAPGATTSQEEDEAADEAQALLYARAGAATGGGLLASSGCPLQHMTHQGWRSTAALRQALHQAQPTSG